MKLTGIEADMLAGKEGEGCRVAMEIIVRLGELYNASELITISQAHIDGCLYEAVGEAGLAFAEKLSELGAKVRIPATLNATSRDIDDWAQHKVGAGYAEKCRRMESAYLAMGAIPAWTCAPYQAGLIPRFGEQIAWAESNAILYANSVLGARTERYGDYTDICCAVTGRAPYFGLHNPENRAGQLLLDCRALKLKNKTDDFAVLGYLTGELANDKIPVLKGIPQWVTGDHLKAFCAAAASSGAVALAHMIGITPEAPDEKRAFHGRRPAEKIELAPDMFNNCRERLSAAGGETEIDAVLIGCPHASAPEVMQVAALLKDKKLKPGAQLWIYTSRVAHHWLTLQGIAPELRAKGVLIIKDSCFINTDLSAWSFKTVMTNSAKYAHYMTGRTGLKAVFAGLRECVRTVLEE